MPSHVMYWTTLMCDTPKLVIEVLHMVCSRSLSVIKCFSPSNVSVDAICGSHNVSVQGTLVFVIIVTSCILVAELFLLVIMYGIAFCSEAQYGTFCIYPLKHRLQNGRPPILTHYFQRVPKYVPNMCVHTMRRSACHGVWKFLTCLPIRRWKWGCYVSPKLCDLTPKCATFQARRRIVHTENRKSNNQSVTISPTNCLAAEFILTLRHT